MAEQLWHVVVKVDGSDALLDVTVPALEATGACLDAEERTWQETGRDVWALAAHPMNWSAFVEPGRRPPLYCEACAGLAKVSA